MFDLYLWRGVFGRKKGGKGGEKKISCCVLLCWMARIVAGLEKPAGSIVVRTHGSTAKISATSSTARAKKMLQDLGFGLFFSFVCLFACLLALQFLFPCIVVLFI